MLLQDRETFLYWGLARASLLELGQEIEVPVSMLVIACILHVLLCVVQGQLVSVGTAVAIGVFGASTLRCGSSHSSS